MDQAASDQENRRQVNALRDAHKESTLCCTVLVKACIEMEGHAQNAKSVETLLSIISGDEQTRRDLSEKFDRHIQMCSGNDRAMSEKDRFIHHLCEYAILSSE